MRKCVAVKLRKTADVYAKFRNMDPERVYKLMKRVWNQTPRNIRHKFYKVHDTQQRFPGAQVFS